MLCNLVQFVSFLTDENFLAHPEDECVALHTVRCLLCTLIGQNQSKMYGSLADLYLQSLDRAQRCEQSFADGLQLVVVQ